MNNVDVAPIDVAVVLAKKVHFRILEATVVVVVIVVFDPKA